LFFLLSTPQEVSPVVDIVIHSEGPAVEGAKAGAKRECYALSSVLGLTYLNHSLISQKTRSLGG
jgi:hypothetical protein